MKVQTLHKNTVFAPKKTLRIKGKLVRLEKPLIMGILNVNPDSFYDGGRYNSVDQAVNRAEQMLAEGVDILDIGGMSSRPGAEIISVDTELSRVLPALEAIFKRFPDIIVSIDTIHAEVARQSVQVGAAIVNDISAGRLDEAMIETVASLKVPYIMMHMRGTPQTMKSLCHYEDLIREMIDYFQKRMELCKQAGINDLIIDPGFGFSKTISQNFFLLSKLQELKLLDLPMLAGLSRKSMIWKSLNISSQEALNGSTALHMYALRQGVGILRVHDVAEAKQVIALQQLLSKASNAAFS